MGEKDIFPFLGREKLIQVLGNGSKQPSNAEVKDMHLPLLNTNACLLGPGRSTHMYGMPCRSWHAFYVLDVQHVCVVCLLGPGHSEANKDLLSLPGNSELSRSNKGNLTEE